MVLAAATLDLRSLAIFRILLGLYLLYDIYSRLSLGKYDLAWYTSEPTEDSFLHPQDTPHHAPLHQIWFHRGTVGHQMLLFIIPAVLASSTMVLGLFHNAWTKTVLFLTVTAYQSRNMHVHDGSDTFVRHLLFWSIFLPMNSYWSLDTKRRHAPSSSPSSSPRSISGLACLALTIQITLMYMGTVAHRTIDIYAWKHLNRVEWLPPKLSAVYYALHGDFAARSNALTQTMCNNPALSQGMTLLAMVLETVPPILCLMDGSRRHIYAFVLFSLHFGLYLTLNLPNWQFVGMLVQVVWIPTPVMDRWTKYDAVAVAKKTDEPVVTNRRLRPNMFSLGVQLFFFAYALYNFGGERGWIPKHDRGDIGEGIRLSQYWVMYGEVSHDSNPTLLTGLVEQPTPAEAERLPPLRYDLYHYIKTGVFKEQDPTEYIPLNMTERYPSPRWERALSQWAAKGGKTRGERLCQVLCRFVNDDRRAKNLSLLDSIILRYQHLRIRPNGSEQRYEDERVYPDTRIKVKCRK